MKTKTKNNLKTASLIALTTLSVASITTFGVAVADAVTPEPDAPITEYQVDYLVGQEIFAIDSKDCITTATPALDGWTFLGWRLDVLDASEVYVPGSKFSSLDLEEKDSTVQLYATYQSTLNLDLQGGIGGNTSVNCVKDMQMKSVAIPTRDGYKFGGYYTQPTGQGTQYYDANGKSTHTNDLVNGITLYAYWVAK